MTEGCSGFSSSDDSGPRQANKKRRRWRASCFLPTACFGPLPNSDNVGKVKGGYDGRDKKGRGSRSWWTLPRWLVEQKKPKRTVPVDAACCDASDDGLRSGNRNRSTKCTVPAAELEPRGRCAGIPSASGVEVNNVRTQSKHPNLDPASQLETSKVKDEPKPESCCLVNLRSLSSSVTKLSTNFRCDEATSSISLQTTLNDSRQTEGCLFLTSLGCGKRFEKGSPCVTEDKLHSIYSVLLLLAIVLLMLALFNRTIASVCAFPSLYLLGQGKETKKNGSPSNKSMERNVPEGQLMYGVKIE